MALSRKSGTGLSSSTLISGVVGTGTVVVGVPGVVPPAGELVVRIGVDAAFGLL